jgi:ATPase family associated with various cellular activities (AAA)
MNMADPHGAQRGVPPRPATKPRNLRDTSVGNIDQIGLDAVGSHARTNPSESTSPNPNAMRMPSQPYVDDSALRVDFPRATVQMRNNDPFQSNQMPFLTPSSSNHWEWDRQRLPSPDPYPPDVRTPTGTPATTSYASLESKRHRHDIIYRLELNAPGSHGTTFRYSLEPFKGLDRSDNPRRRDLAVMDLSSSVTGFWPSTKRKNQLRDNFLEEPDPDPFVIGEDFVARSHTFYSIRIHSPRVLDVLRSLIRYYPSLGLQLQETEVFFMYPYRVLVYYYEDLEKTKDNCILDGDQDELPLYHGATTLGRATNKDLSVVLGYLKPFYDREILPELERHRKGLAKFSSLWLLFKPGCTVFARVKGQLMFFKVLSANREVDNAGESSGPWSIIVWGLYFDGYLLKRQARRFKIHEYHDERDIQKLPIKPIEYLLEGDGRKENLIKRGMKYYDFVCEVPLYRRYSGPINGDQGDRYVGDVIIDPAGYSKESSSAKQVPSNLEVMFGGRVAEDDFGIVLGEPPDFGGGFYSKLNDRRCSKTLGRKQWLAFDVISFLEFDYSDRPWKSLIIDEKDLDLVRSIAGRYKGSNIQPWTADFIPGKGQGQVVLLHGSPGTGKTMTVECIATQMGRPLMSLTAADIGTAEASAEANLAKYLGLATKWGAIVVIDEAETFLTKRKEGDLSRNAVVTAFLRALEYYSGKIFLTTNAPGQIDDAVSSRIHLAIPYKLLTKEKRQEVWVAHIQQLHKQQAATSWPTEVPKVIVESSTQNFITSENGVSDIEDLEMSGRDIRNAFQTAVALARFDAQNQAMMEGRAVDKEIKMEPDHFKKAMKTKTELKKVINKITGQTERQRATEAGTWNASEPAN